MWKERGIFWTTYTEKETVKIADHEGGGANGGSLFPGAVGLRPFGNGKSQNN